MADRIHDNLMRCECGGAYRVVSSRVKSAGFAYVKCNGCGSTGKYYPPRSEPRLVPITKIRKISSPLSNQ